MCLSDCFERVGCFWCSASPGIVKIEIGEGVSSDNSSFHYHAPQLVWKVESFWTAFLCSTYQSCSSSLIFFSNSTFQLISQLGQDRCDNQPLPLSPILSIVRNTLSRFWTNTNDQIWEILHEEEWLGRGVGVGMSPSQWWEGWPAASASILSIGSWRAEPTLTSAATARIGRSSL